MKFGQGGTERVSECVDHEWVRADEFSQMSADICLLANPREVTLWAGVPAGRQK